MIEDRARSHGSGDARLGLDRHRVSIVHVAVGVDGELVALEDVDEVILVMVKAIHLAGLHLHHPGDPIVVFGENLITRGGDTEWGDETRNFAARLAQLVLLDKQHERLGIADILHLSARTGTNDEGHFESWNGAYDQKEGFSCQSSPLASRDVVCKSGLHCNIVRLARVSDYAIRLVRTW
eukprot:1877008-Pyramimonas_sp.AAC.1